MKTLTVTLTLALTAATTSALALDPELEAVNKTAFETVDFYAADTDRDHPIDFAAFTARLRINAAMNEALAAPEALTLINVIDVPTGKLDETVAMAREAGLPPVEGLAFNAALYRIIRTDGDRHDR